MNTFLALRFLLTNALPLRVHDNALAGGKRISLLWGQIPRGQFRVKLWESRCTDTCKTKISKEIVATIIYMYKEKYEEGWWPKIESDPSQG